MNAQRLNDFRESYGACLMGAVMAHPEEYGLFKVSSSQAATYANVRVEVAVDFIRHDRLFELNINTPGWRATASHFRIENTYPAWEAWFNGEL